MSPTAATRTAPCTTGARIPPTGLRPFRTPVRGHPYAGVPGQGMPRAGQPASLVREPTNPADPLAVAVWVDDDRTRWRIGYLDRGVAARLAPRLDRGQRLSAQVDGWVSEPDGRWRRPVVLVLPEVAEVGDGTDGVSPRGGTDAGPPGRSSGLWGRPPGVSRRVLS